jgi:hypothetical protein
MSYFQLHVCVWCLCIGRICANVCVLVGVCVGDVHLLRETAMTSNNKFVN